MRHLYLIIVVILIAYPSNANNVCRVLFDLVKPKSQALMFTECMKIKLKTSKDRSHNASFCLEKVSEIQYKIQNSIKKHCLY